MKTLGFSNFPLKLRDRASRNQLIKFQEDAQRKISFFEIDFKKKCASSLNNFYNSTQICMGFNSNIKHLRY